MDKSILTLAKPIMDSGSKLLALGARGMIEARYINFKMIVIFVIIVASLG